ncbi:type II secretion system protein [bacterium]|nr:type II secretion system protein [bacterium]
MYLARKQSGFTIVELLMCIVSIGILAAVVIPQMEEYRRKVRDVVALSDLRNYIIAQESYWSEHHRYVSCERLAWYYDGEYQYMDNTGWGTNCEAVLPGFKYSEGVAVYSEGMDFDGTYIAAQACHARGTKDQDNFASVTFYISGADYVGCQSNTICRAWQDTHSCWGPGPEG